MYPLISVCNGIQFVCNIVDKLTRENVFLLSLMIKLCQLICYTDTICN